MAFQVDWPSRGVARPCHLEAPAPSIGRMLLLHFSANAETECLLRVPRAEHSRQPVAGATGPGQHGVRLECCPGYCQRFNRYNRLLPAVFHINCLRRGR